MDEESESRTYRPAPKLSMAPSWAMVGFVLGALTVLAWPRHREERVMRASPPRAPAVSLATPKMTTIEAVFDAWEKYAVWDHDLTQVSLWNSDTSSFSDNFEVLRVGDEFYFRSLTRLSRPVLVHGVPDGSPLQFTETEELKRRFLQEAADENWRAMREALKSGQSSPP